MMKLNFSKHLAAQDMVTIIMKAKGLAVKEAIEFAINRDIFDRILKAGYASIALELWGHGGPNRRWERLNEPLIEIELDESRQSLIDEIIKTEKVDVETAVAYFLLFTMESLGYHI